MQQVSAMFPELRDIGEQFGSILRETAKGSSSM
jgi:hypothetical protein